MYLVSLYFEDRVSNELRRLIYKLSEVTGNRYMVENQVPPHLTVGQFGIRDVDRVLEFLVKEDFEGGEVDLVGFGGFKSSVIYISAVYNEYLHGVMSRVYGVLKNIEGIELGRYYKPFQVFPHITLSKTLTDSQFSIGINVVKNEFRVMSSRVVRLGVSRVKPYRECLRINF